MELVGESEKMRMKKLEELSKNIDTLTLSPRQNKGTS
ncbi:unnamed protein product [Brassica rapa subsp. trilocularis]